MELRHLKYFAVVAEEENITRASERLHISQPSLSRQIRDLEHEVGVPLLVHGPKSIQLTAAGKVFQTGALDVLARAGDIVSQVRAMARQLDGDLHVGYAPSLTTEILPQATRKFQTMCGQVRVHLHDLSTEQMLEGLRAGKLNLALLAKPSSTALNGMIYKELVQIRPSIAMSPHHPLASETTISPRMLSGHAMVAYDAREYPEHRNWMQRITKVIKSNTQIMAEYDSATSLIAAVESGIGIALVHQDFAKLSGARLKVIPMPASVSGISLGICWPKTDQSAPTHHFISAALRPEKAIHHE